MRAAAAAPASGRRATPGRPGRPASSCSATAARTSAAVTASGAGTRAGRMRPRRRSRSARRGRPRRGSGRPRAARRRSSARCSRAARAGRHAQTLDAGPGRTRASPGRAPPARVTRAKLPGAGRHDGRRDGRQRAQVSPFTAFDRESWRALAAGSSCRWTRPTCGPGLPRRPDRPRRGGHRLPAAGPAAEPARRRPAAGSGRRRPSSSATRTAKVPFVIGVAGSVAVGKSTTARMLQALLAAGPDTRASTWSPPTASCCPTRCSRRAG